MYYIEYGEYFTINRARQFGKTTTFNLLIHRLKDEYLVVRLSFEATESYFRSLEVFAKNICLDIADALPDADKSLIEIWKEPLGGDDVLRDLRRKINAFCSASQKPVVLLIDEVDRASDFAVFSAFLGLLREMYLERKSGRAKTFQSVILAGVHDIKNLRKKIHPESAHSYNSPWNIAADFTIDMSFSAPEIATMLISYEADHNSGMNIQEISERIYYYTSGYPFLVSRLCKTVAELPLEWTIQGIDEAERLLLKSTNTLFDDLIKNVQQNPELESILKSILLEGSEFTYSRFSPEIDLAITYGIISEASGSLTIANIIFETLLTDYFISCNEIASNIKRQRMPINEVSDNKSLFIHDGKLDMNAVATRFSAFMRSEYRDEDGVFIERQARLLFLSFLKAVINGSGNYAVEPQTRGNRRMDIVVFHGGKEYIIELKIWRGEQSAQNAYDQLAGYLISKGQEEGWLISFANTLKAPRENRVFTHNGCTINETVIAYRDKE